MEIIMYAPVAPLILSTASLDAFQVFLALIIALVLVRAVTFINAKEANKAFKREQPQRVAELQAKFIKLKANNARRFPLNNASICKE